MIAEDRYDSLFQWYAQQYKVDWLLIKAQAKAESALNPDAVNPWSGARGLAQFMERTWEEWKDGTAGIQETPPGRSLRRDDPEDAIRSMCAYMAWLLRVLNNSIVRALAAYNFGIGRVMRGDPWPAETREYVERIQRFHKAYLA